MIPSNESLGGFMIALYVMVALGTCIELIRDRKEKYPEYPTAVVIIGVLIVGTIWPVYWAEKITHKLNK